MTERSFDTRPGRASIRCGAATVAILLATPAVALAHTGAGPAHGLAHGFLHPLLGLDHVLAMLAVGLWGAQRGGRAIWLLPLVFVLAMLAGGVAGMFGIEAPAVEAGILASVLVLGAAVALAVRAPLGGSAVVVAAFALFHGHAHGAEMPVALSGAAYGAGFALATALLHAAGIGFARAALHTATARHALLVRAAGAFICAAGAALWLL